MCSYFFGADFGSIEPVTTITFLSCFGFFVSLFFFCCPFAMIVLQSKPFEFD